MTIHSEHAIMHRLRNLEPGVHASLPLPPLFLTTTPIRQYSAQPTSQHHEFPSNVASSAIAHVHTIALRLVVPMVQRELHVLFVKGCLIAMVTTKLAVGGMETGFTDMTPLGMHFFQQLNWLL